jgi:hypothetical protein
MKSRRLLFAAILAVASLAGASVTAAQASAAAATITSYSFSESYTYQDALPECFSPVLVGTGPVTEFGSGQIVETAQGFSINGQGGMVYHVTFPDGSFIDGSAADHFVFVVYGPVTVYTDTIREPRTIYSADGIAVGSVMIHAVTHVTYFAASDQVTGSVDRFFFTCN